MDSYLGTWLISLVYWLSYSVCRCESFEDHFDQTFILGVNIYLYNQAVTTNAEAVARFSAGAVTALSRNNFFRFFNQKEFYHFQARSSDLYPQKSSGVRKTIRNLAGKSALREIQHSPQTMKMIISENDKRLYRVITLENGLRAMLVSSAHSETESKDEDEAMEEDATSESGSLNSGHSFSYVLHQPYQPAFCLITIGVWNI